MMYNHTKMVNDGRFTLHVNMVTWALPIWKGAPNERARDTRAKDASEAPCKTFYTQETTSVREGEGKTTSQRADTPATNRSHRCYRYR